MKDAIKAGCDEATTVPVPDPEAEQKLTITRMREKAIAECDYQTAAACDAALKGDQSAIEILQLMMENDMENHYGGYETRR